METDRKNFSKFDNEIITIKEIKMEIRNFKKIFYIFINLIILLYFTIISFIFMKNKLVLNNLFRNKNITYVINQKTNSNQNEISSDDIICLLVKNKLKNRIQPFDYENEFVFFTELISCRIPFSFIRFADGENLIMKGIPLHGIDRWYWNSTNKKFQDSLIESASICTNNNNFIAIPCKNWIEVSKSILSFSNCSSSKYMSYSTIFTNRNYPIFKDWILSFINSSNRWKIILVANSIINSNITWAYKFFPVSDQLVENWDNYSISLLPKLSDEAKNNNLIFFISAGPASNIIISYLSKVNNNNIYIDFGSSIEFITKGYSTRAYSRNEDTTYFRCEPFYLQNKSIIYIDK